MFMRSYDVVVVGGGVVGAAIFHALTRDGHAVALVDRRRLGMGCTAWSGGVVRCFHPDPTLSDKAVFGWTYYRDFEAQTGIHCPFVRSGFLYFPDESKEGEAIGEARRLAARIPIQWLPQAALKDRFGTLLVGTPAGAVYEPEAGYMNPLDVTRAWVRSGQTLGGDVFEGTEVQRLVITGGRLDGVDTNLGQIRARRIVIALGPDTPGFLDRLGIPHDLYAQAIQIDLRRPHSPVERQPAFLDDQFGVHGRPDPVAGIYIGLPTGVRGVESLLSCGIDPRHSEAIHHAGARRWRWVGHSALAGGLRAADGYSSDGRGRVLAVDWNGPLLIATGFNGGGFKMAPWIGREMVRLIGCVA
jgi:glycine/D-amino acid oxidase-like deaminating enzyme